MITLKTPIHPGEMLQEVLSEVKIAPEELDNLIGVREGTTALLIDEKADINAGLVFQLGKLCSQSPGYWMNMQTSYELASAANNVELESALEKITPLKI